MRTKIYAGSGQPHPVSRCVADPGDLAAQHRVLVAQDQQLGVLAPDLVASTPQSG